MTSKEHKKHSAITRPAYGNFSRNEWAIVGAPCGDIKTLADRLIKSLSAYHKCAYVDAQHGDARHGDARHVDQEAALPGRLAMGAAAEYTNAIDFHQFNLQQDLNQFQFRQLFSEMDLVLVNGNHQQAKAQVVMIDSRKKASLQKRLEQLTNVELFILAEGEQEVFSFVQEAIPHWQQLPLLHVGETEKIVRFFSERLQQAKPKLNGMVLAGGRSQRMGHDKGAIGWHGQEQRYYMADLLKGFCSSVYISCRPEQQQGINNSHNTLPDTFPGLGPYGAILSAFQAQPDSAWLVVACDLPLLDAPTLQYLTDNRNTAALATTFKSPHDNFPEPLITIWEPKSYPVLLAFMAQGYTCPRKVLINTHIQLLEPPKAEALLNVNTPEEAERVRSILQK
ncbi:bifunctional molybdopterin-guanine dinucleotide biosynthesis protein MobB/MobA [Flammeovirgaceae bacterium 311]|nr:bifunctional molybdopterin-guanine dinucleotide biosynthesis protein MobB/MobA [Flammeovirgaceae bacterium 311]